MRFIIHFLLVSSFSNSNGTIKVNFKSTKGKTYNSGDPDVSYDLFSIDYELMDWIEMGRKNFIRTEKETLVFLEDQELGRSRSLVWKGIYSNIENNIVNQTVAVKIFPKQKYFDEEFAIFNALNAANNSEIENHGIPRVYYHGPILDKYYGIAMTLFDRNLKEYYLYKGGNITNINFLSFFRQAVKGLKYLNKKHVLHNDIKPQNLFLRGQKLFISDFDLATLHGTKSTGYTPLFATARFYGNHTRNPMDDLESLVYSMWWISGVPMARLWDTEETEGFIRNKSTKEEAEARVLEKLKHYQNAHVYKVMRYICVDEMLSDRSVPSYDVIIAKLKKAIEMERKQPEIVSLTNCLMRTKSMRMTWKTKSKHSNVQ